MSVQLTAGGKAPPITSQFELINAYHREIAKALIAAANLHDEHQRNERMRTWVEAHDEFDELYATRSTQYQREHQVYLGKMSAVCALADRANAIYRRLSTESVETMEREMHWPICDHLAQFLVITARDTGVSDFSTVLDCFMRDNTSVAVNRTPCPF